MTSVLIRFMHGLGDAVQFTAVLQHIRQHRPDWEVDVYSLRGKHSAFHGLCRRSYHEQEGERPSRPYGARYDLGWFENYNGYTDRPNSKITNCFQEVFHIPYDANLGRYQVQVSAAAMERAGEYLGSIGCQRSAVSDQPLLIGNSVSTNGKQGWGFEPFQKLQQELHFPPLRFVLLQRQVAFRTERQNLPSLPGFVVHSCHSLPPFASFCCA